VTEPVETTLADIIENMRDEEIRCDEVELKLHLLEIIEGLIFLNETTKTAHLNLCPENIFITTNGKWKIGGFGFMIQQQQGDMVSDNITLSRACVDPAVNPNMQYCGPEFFNTDNKFH
jgi:SCY1-like protein 2